MLCVVIFWQKSYATTEAIKRNWKCQTAKYEHKTFYYFLQYGINSMGVWNLDIILSKKKGLL